MDILIDNPILSALIQSVRVDENILSALKQSVEVDKNIEAEALRKAKVKEQTARAMDRASNEWR